MELYCSIEENLPIILKETDLSLDELEYLVGRFQKNSCRAGQLRGKMVYTMDGRVQIRKCFGNKLLWEKEL